MVQHCTEICSKNCRHHILVQLKFFTMYATRSIVMYPTIDFTYRFAFIQIHIHFRHQLLSPFFRDIIQYAFRTLGYIPSDNTHFHSIKGMCFKPLTLESDECTQSIIEGSVFHTFSNPFSCSEGTDFYLIVGKRFLVYISYHPLLQKVQH